MKHPTKFETTIKGLMKKNKLMRDQAEKRYGDFLVDPDGFALRAGEEMRKKDFYKVSKRIDLEHHPIKFLFWPFTPDKPSATIQKLLGSVSTNSSENLRPRPWQSLVFSLAFCFGRVAWGFSIF